MTKDNPEILCDECKKFDRNMNRSDGVSLDMFVQCHHEIKDKMKKEIDEIQTTFDLLKECLYINKVHPYEGIVSMILLIVSMHRISGISYREFKETMNAYMDALKDDWETEN